MQRNIKSATYLVALALGACATAPAPREHAGLSALAEGFGSGEQGCAYVLRARGAVPYEGASGFANAAERLELSPDDLFDVGSVSKSFTAAIILDLEQRGALSRADAISRYVSGLPSWGERVTIADLMSMRSGIPDFRVDTDAGGWSGDRLRGSELAPADPVSFDLIMRTIRGLTALDFEPGARYAYSNTNYMLLRAAAERAGNAPFGVQVERIGRDLAQIEAHAPAYREGRRQSPSRVIGYDVTTEGGAAPSLSNWDVLGASSVWVSVEDLARWGEALIADEARFARQAEVGILRYPDQDQDRGYASGLMTLSRNGERIVYHLGGTEGFSSGLFMRPARGEVLAFSCNMSPELFYARGMAGGARSSLERYRDTVFLDVWLAPDARQ